ncbi:MAG: adenylate kinase [Erysipelotrichaceae bacterium]
MNLLIMGAAGAGKGTQAEKIVKKYKLAHISTGDMLRKEIANNTVLGVKAKEYIDGGHLVPDDVVIGMVKNRLNEKDCDNGFLLDGFPRTLQQAQSFAIILDGLGKKVTHVINLEVDFDILTERITGRRICPSCKSIYHITAKPSKVAGICDNCQTELIQRSDDTKEELAIRLAEYHKLTEPVLDYYRNLNLVSNINSSQEVDKVFADIVNLLGDSHD